MQRLQGFRITRRQAGTTLIELLVVIVVFLTGILAIVQIFPGGFKILSATRNNTVATSLARAEMARLSGESEQLPEQILPVSYLDIGGGKFQIVPDPTRKALDLSPTGGGNFDSAGNIFSSGGTAIANWKYVSGPNVIRHVVGEGRRIPSPVLVNGNLASRLVLNLAPALVDPRYVDSSGGYGPLVYGNDMVPLNGLPPAGNNPLLDYEYYVNAPGTPAGKISLGLGSTPRKYRISFTWAEAVGGQVSEHELVAYVLPVPAISGPLNLPYVTVDLSSMVTLDAGGSFQGVEPDSLRVARIFDNVSGGSWSTVDPYEYMIPQDGSGNLDSLGAILLNPYGYNYSEILGNGRRVPLVAKVDYDVFDWRVLREDFRIPETVPANYTLPVGNLKVKGNPDVDGSIFVGMGFRVPSLDASNNFGFFPASDFVLMDVETGGVFLYDYRNPADPTPPSGPVNDFAVDPTRSSYTVDKSRGEIKFNDYDRDPSNGLQLRLVCPDGAVQTVNAAGRPVRALYMARNEWAVQVFKAAEKYNRVYTAPKGNTDYYVGTSAAAFGFPAVPGENAALASHRIYFSDSEDGRKVVIDTVWFDWAFSGPGGSESGFSGLFGDPFSIGRDRTSADFDPYADISTDALARIYPSLNAANRAAVDSGTGFTFSPALNFTQYGYAVRGVKGGSLNVRTFWNSQNITITGDSPTNYSNFNRFAEGWRHQSTETFLTKGVQ